MNYSCLRKSEIGDKIVICYKTEDGCVMSRKLSPYQREFEVIYKNADGVDGAVPFDGKGSLLPIVGSNNPQDGMHRNGNNGFRYTWLVDPSYNYIVKVIKKKK